MKPSRNHDEPRRVESQARMTLPTERPPEPSARMGLTEATVIAGNGYDTTPEVAETQTGDMEAGPPLRTTETSPEVIALFPTGRIPPPDDWIDMASAPLDGTMIRAKDAEGNEYTVVRRRTSGHNGFRWVRREFWSSPMDRVPIEVKLVGWRMLDGFVAPGAIVA
jgi:hypothetical protein